MLDDEIYFTCDLHQIRLVNLFHDSSYMTRQNKANATVTSSDLLSISNVKVYLKKIKQRNVYSTCEIMNPILTENVTLTVKT